MRYLTVKETAKAIRAFLKKKGIKPVSVICSRGSSRSVSIHLRPEDHSYELTHELRQFQEGDFDAMTDSYNYAKRTIEWEGEQVLVGAKFVLVFKTA